MAAVLVHIDLDGTAPHPASLAALAAGRRLASSWGATLYAAVIAHDAERRTTAVAVPGIAELQVAIARAGADKLVAVTTDAPIEPLWSAIGGAWQTALDYVRPRVVLFGADSPAAAELAPRTGAKLAARLLGRARAVGDGELELRDRDGGYARIADAGAAVAQIGGATPPARCIDDIDLVVLAAATGADTRVELVSSAPAEPALAGEALVVLGADAARDASCARGAERLAARLGATLVRGADLPAESGLAPQLCVVIGDAAVDLAGATSVIRLAAAAAQRKSTREPTRTDDAAGVLRGKLDTMVAELVARMEGP